MKRGAGGKSYQDAKSYPIGIVWEGRVRDHWRRPMPVSLVWNRPIPSGDRGQHIRKEGNRGGPEPVATGLGRGISAQPRRCSRPAQQGTCGWRRAEPMGPVSYNGERQNHSVCSEPRSLGVVRHRLPEWSRSGDARPNEPALYWVALHPKSEDQLQAELRCAVTSRSKYGVPPSLIRCGTTTAEIAG
jgi:hypothetical protein